MIPLSLRSDLARPKRKPRAHPEQDLQIAVAALLHKVLMPDVLWTAIGHGGGGKTRGAILKAMGLLPGLADIMICYAWGDMRGRTLWIELKSKDGRPSKEQGKFARHVEQLGHVYYICRTLADVEFALRRCGVPNRIGR